MTTKPAHANSMLAAAYRYARSGWPVFPCLPGQKIPATRHGFLEATTDPDKITWWWSRHPEQNLAIATGSPGPDVLDVDVRQDGNGFAAFNRLRREGLLDGTSAYIRTPSGGLHAYFTGSQQGNGRLPRHHLDFRSHGGYILAPPSQIGGRHYELLRHHEGTAGLDWATVTRLLDPEPQHRPHRAAGRPADTSRLAGWVARLPEGNRNDGLFWAANRALDAGLTDLGELAEAARQAGLDDREITRTLASARRHADRPVRTDPSARRTPQRAAWQREMQAPVSGRPPPGPTPEGQDIKQETQPDVEARMTEPETGSGPEARSAPETRSAPQALWPERHALVVATVPDGAEPDQDKGAEQDASWIAVPDLEAGS